MDSSRQRGPDDLDLATLAAAPTTLTLDGRTLTLTAELWRDYMPISPPDGRPLRGVLTVSSTDGQALPAGLTADRAWIVNGQDVWSTPVEALSDGAAAPSRAWLAQDGPKWGPGITVNVVLRLIDRNGQTHFLQVPNVPITRTD